MGQRTAFLVKRNYKDGSSNVRLVHHQWGIIALQHRYLMREFFTFNTMRGNEPETLKNYFLLNSYYGVETKDRDISYRGDKTGVYIDKDYKKGEKAPDVFDLKTRCRYFESTDNNNGGMIIEITEDPDNAWRSEIKSIKTAFVLGDEECENYEDCFKKMVSGEDYIRITSHDEEDEQGYIKQWIAMWKNFVELYEIEEITDKEKE